MKNKLKMAIMEFISVHVMTSQEKEELLREFQEMDKNGDGMVSKNELCMGKDLRNHSLSQILQ